MGLRPHLPSVPACASLLLLTLLQPLRAVLQVAKVCRHRNQVFPGLAATMCLSQVIIQFPIFLHPVTQCPSVTHRRFPLLRLEPSCRRHA